MLKQKFQRIRAILFDLHHTLTKTRINILTLAREAAENSGIELEHIPDDILANAIKRTDQWMKDYQIEKGVDIHWGWKPEHWLEVNRLLIDDLRIPNVTDEMLLEYETCWKDIMATNWESLVDDAKYTLESLKERGYTLGICTRRHDDPDKLLREWNIHDLFSTIHWTGVPGYAKPNPFTLLKAADEIGINPRLCAFVGNYVDADVCAAKRAEMLPILVVWANPGEKDLITDDTPIIKNIGELLHLFPSPAS